MSIRQMFPGSIVKPGFNPLAAQTPIYTYNLYSWGDNQFGQLGLGNTATRSSPNQVGALTDWLSVVCRYNTLALKADGTIWAWGRNQSGQLGLGNTTYYSSPKQVGALTTWSVVATINNASFALKTDGTIWTWGGNSLGALGLGDTVSRSSPVQVGALTNWAKIRAVPSCVDSGLKDCIPPQRVRSVQGGNCRCRVRKQGDLHDLLFQAPRCACCRRRRLRAARRRRLRRPGRDL